MSLRRFVLIAIAFACLPLTVSAKDTYPKLANYYLEFFHRGDYEQLAKWDLLVIQADMMQYNPGFFDVYRAKKPDGILVPYIYSSMIHEERNGFNGLPLRKVVYDAVNQGNWWLRDANRNKVQPWPDISAINITNQDWQNFYVNYLRDTIGTEHWNGVMFDIVDSEIGHYSRSGIDITNDGVTDSTNVVNQKWREGMAQLFAKTKAALGDNYYIIPNGNSIDAYQKNTNGRIFEAFPTPWEGNGSWQATMYQYLIRLPSLNKKPNFYIINGSTTKPGGQDYRKMRFGLTSALLGDGYYSFDYGSVSHQQMWWFDEYDVSLGRAESSYYNLLDPGNTYVRAGLWRRDFENGSAIVNSTNKDQLYIFKGEQFEKIKGTQDRNFNDGSKVNYIKLSAGDGIIMKSLRQDIVGSTFPNGTLVRVFSNTGQQRQSSFFANRSGAKPNTAVLLTDLDNDGNRDKIIAQDGILHITRVGIGTMRIAPYGTNFKNRLSIATYDFNKDGLKEIIVAPVAGGGPHIKVYDVNGKARSGGFFAFDKNFHGGVFVAAGDVNNDGQGEIIAAPGAGLPTTVKFFTIDGKNIGSLLAYDKNFRGGVTTAIGDVDGDGSNELITGSASGGSHIRIFDYTGRLKGQFMAFDPKSGAGITVIANDINNDGKIEILAATASF